MSLIRSRSSNKEFIQEVEKHERAWGHNSYTGRPSLDKIMNARVVAFWYPNGTDPDIYTTITLHSELKEISAYVEALVRHTKTRAPVVRLARVFLNQNEVKIKSVQVIFDLGLKA